MKNEPDNEAARNKQTNSQAFRISHSGLVGGSQTRSRVAGGRPFGERSGQGLFFMHSMPKLDETPRAARACVSHKKLHKNEQNQHMATSATALLLRGRRTPRTRRGSDMSVPPRQIRACLDPRSLPPPFQVTVHPSPQNVRLSRWSRSRAKSAPSLCDPTRL